MPTRLFVSILCEAFRLDPLQRVIVYESAGFIAYDVDNPVDATINQLRVAIMQLCLVDQRMVLGMVEKLTEFIERLAQKDLDSKRGRARSKR